MDDVPAVVRPALRRLARRLAVGLFLDTWPGWAVGATLAAGCVALVCRLSVPAASPVLPWLWLAPVLAAVPALAICAVRAYSPPEIVALADSLSGGDGVLLTLLERPGAAWSDARGLHRVANLAMPRLRPRRALAFLPLALAFLAATLLVPQRLPGVSNTALADDIAAELGATVAALKEQNLITPDEEERLEAEIDRVRKDALERMDASSWEAADALRQTMQDSVAARQDAAAWAQEALARHAAAVAEGLGASEGASADAQAELAAALDALAKSGLLDAAPAELQKLAAMAGTWPADPETLRQLAEALGEYLGEGDGRWAELAALGEGAGRFDPSEFPLDEGFAADGDGNPGRGAATRGRADAPLTWGDETQPADRFKAQTLPPGHVRSPDDWAPIVELPGAPQAAPEAGAAAAARAYADDAGQAANRRTLAPRHQSAVRKYFQP